MEIKYHGYSCFHLKGKNVDIVMDPFSADLGINMPTLKADIVTISHDHKNHACLDPFFDKPAVLDWPGEYEKNDTAIVGIDSFHNPKDGEDLGPNTIFIIHVDDLKITHLGDQGCKLTPEQLEQIGDTDILMIPVGGGRTLNAEKALEVVEQIDPRIVMPMHYDLPGINKELEPVEKFMTIMGAKDFEFQESYKIVKSNLPEDKTEIVVLSI